MAQRVLGKRQGVSVSVVVLTLGDAAERVLTVDDVGHTIAVHLEREWPD
jgi:hypothetical protein